MKFGILYSYWSRTWDCGLPEYAGIAKKVAGLGFDVLEISADHIYHMSSGDLQKLNALARDHGLQLTANSGPGKDYDLAASAETVRRQGIKYFTTILEKMQRVDSKLLVGAIYSHWPCDFSEIDKEVAWKRSISCLQEISKTAEDLGIDIALEVLNRNETYILTTCQEAVDYCQRVGSPNVKILLDTYHMNIEEDNLPDALRAAGNRLGHLHVGECNRKLPGMNNSIDWLAVGQALRDIEYDGPVVMEPFLLTGGPVGNAIRVWRDLSDHADEATMDRYAAESLAFLKKTLA